MEDAIWIRNPGGRVFSECLWYPQPGNRARSHWRNMYTVNGDSALQGLA